MRQEPCAPCCLTRFSGRIGEGLEGVGGGATFLESLRALVMSVVILAMHGRLAQAGPDEMISGMKENFSPSRPPVLVQYEVVYRLLGLRLVRVARAQATGAEGEWSSEGRKSAAFFVEASLDTLERPGEEARKHVAIHDRMVVALSNPDLETYIFVRRARQWFNPLVGQSRVVDHVKVYDMRSGELHYLFEDYVSGATNTALDGTADMARQGREVAILMKLMSQVYRSGTQEISFANSPAIYADMDGTARRFRARTSFERSPVALKGKKPRVLRVELRTEKDGGRRPGRLVIWVMSLTDVSLALGDERLCAEARVAKDWCVVPLAFDYDLAVGSLYGSLTDVRVMDELPRTR